MEAEFDSRERMACDALIACFECDLLIARQPVPVGSRAKCPRCGHVLHQPVQRSIEKIMALAITGLLLFIPAVSMPLLTLNLLGKSEQETMLSGIIALYEGGYGWVAVLVGLCSIIIPLLKLVLLFYVSVCLSLKSRCSGVAKSFRLYHRLDTWGMLEVYLLGILVSIVKLLDTAEVVPGIGLYCFVGLLLVTVLLSASLDEVSIWEAIEAQ